MIIYILTNEAMPGLIKIGRTENLDLRLRSLDTTGVPLPFQCYYAARVKDAEFVEKKLHDAFGDFRIRMKREFFRLDPFRAKAALELASIEEVTPKGDIINDADDQNSLNRVQLAAPRFRFSLAEIPQNATLVFARDASFTAVVISDTKICFEGNESSLSGAARVIMERLGYKWSAVQGPQYWLYEGETLVERRQRLEAEQSDEAA